MTATKIHVAGYHKKTSVQSRAIDVMGEALNRALGDEITFRFDSDIADFGRYGYELLDLIEGEELDICYIYSSYLTERVPEFGVFELPYQINGRTSGYSLLDGKLGQSIASAVSAKTDFRVLAYWDNGVRHISNSRREILSPEDCVGLKMRTTPNRVHQETFRALGFETVYCDVQELAAAARDGIVDAQENPLTNITSYGLEEYHRFVTLTGHLFGVNALLVGAKAYASWPDSVRSALADAVAEATVAQRRFATEADSISMKHLQDRGTKISELTAEQRAAFATAVSPIVEKERARFDVDLLAAFDAQRS